ncbi:hypothetical protein R1flu_010845 [Riccia fluitans]|uniref:Uncharacterized protein n=1 Tax=Riccia fluitans TaxID=41844 RepID=A0ABD1Z646_9MARC
MNCRGIAQTTNERSRDHGIMIRSERGDAGTPSTTLSSYSQPPERALHSKSHHKFNTPRSPEDPTDSAADATMIDLGRMAGIKTGTRSLFGMEFPVKL